MNRLKRMIIGVKKEQKQPNVEEAINEISNTEESITKQCQILNIKITKELHVAKNARTGAAQIRAVANKRRMQQRVDQLEAMLATLQQQRDALDNAVSNNEMHKTMQFASGALKLEQSNLDVDQIYKMMDDVAESKETGEECSNALAVQEISATEGDEMLAQLLEEHDDTLMYFPCVEQQQSEFVLAHESHDHNKKHKNVKEEPEPAM